MLREDSRRASSRHQPEQRVTGRNSHRDAQQGFSLLEVLVAILILSIGLLGLAGLQAASLRANQNAYFTSQSNLLAYDIVDRMRANRQAAQNGGYNIAIGDPLPTGDDQAAADLKAWHGLILNLLPQGTDEHGNAIGGGAVDVADDGVATITIEWFDARISEDEGGPVRRATLVTQI
ncbi:MAG: type IV pilus modification protein PilV [Aquisalimonadaceae bacterium]